ncbi:hypothetical protein BS50DRAFT_576028 [Corynespora cassiicola Philippines]|uniref:Double-strand-break repair protein rad21 n=1 Tax=Corynespora cassiicola Philippines TaxID=1448308 RepID=A0A2T2NHS4_CORCC|nr:hypothetical protein BS50DRAFT_576028 [Corynespora cassiicola Philippines]
MFFPEQLLSKQGPLARVWLAANVEKKLTKTQVLQDKIVDDIEVIVKPDGVAGGPLALRLSGQLLLGVVRIYSRKARYLLDDCNDALWKIKMAFRPGNIDLPTTQSHLANPASLTLPDVITEIDLLAPMPDPSMLLSQPLLDFDLGIDDSAVPDWDQSQLLSGSIEQARAEPMDLDFNDDLGLDIGDGDGLEPFDEGTSIERGRDAPLERRASEEFDSVLKGMGDDDLNLDIGDGDDDLTEMPAAPEVPLDTDMDIDMGGMGGMTELEPPVEPSGVEELALNRARESLSPLSSIRSSVERDLEQTFQEQNTAAFEPEPEPEQEEEEEAGARQANRAKRRKLIEQDAETQVSNTQIRDQQNNRERILKAPSFLPRDPVLLALMNMQKSGGFVSSILGDGRSQGWAPELRGILSLEVVSRPQKRKRDSGVADLGTEEEDATAGAEKTPQLEFDQTEPELGDLGADFGADTTLPQDEQQIELPEDIGIGAEERAMLEEEEAFSPVADNFDDTTIPLLHPADSGPVSLGTKHAVHLLRERFGPEAEHSEAERQKTSVLFQDMLPEATTSKADATKMFFEILVLATKDAVKVEQPVNELGGPLRIRGKRGLWGSWAETSAGGELASQSAPEAAPEASAAVAAEA